MSISNRSAALFSDDAQLRSLLGCFGVSIALHSLALALFALPGTRTTARSDAATVLTASFAPESAPATPSLEKPAARPGAPTPKSQSEDPAPQLAQTSSAATIPAQPAKATPAPSLTSEIPSAQPTISPPAPGLSGSPAAVAENLPIDSMDAGLLEKYRLALIDAAGRYGGYPPQARDRGWQGRVEIRLVIDANGTTKSASIKTSSRYAILDDRALDMVKKGKSLARIPPALYGRELIVDVPVIFRLRTG